MAQEKHRKLVGGYGPVDGEEAVNFLHCPCSRQQPAGTSALLYVVRAGGVVTGLRALLASGLTCKARLQVRISAYFWVL